MRYLTCLILCILTSCSMYKRDFDGIPSTGVPSTSVTTLEKMIVESPCGEESFTGCVPKLVEIQNKPSCKNSISNIQDEPFQRRIWMAPKGDRPVYIYFEEDMQCEEL